LFEGQLVITNELGVNHILTFMFKCCYENIQLWYPVPSTVRPKLEVDSKSGLDIQPAESGHYYTKKQI